MLVRFESKGLWHGFPSMAECSWKHRGQKGMTPEEARELQKTYEQRCGAKK